MSEQKLEKGGVLGNPNLVKVDQPLNERLNNEPLRVLSEEQWAFWKENGYVIIKNAVPKEYVERAYNLIWEFEEKNPNDKSTWYTPERAPHKLEELKGSGMVELYNHQYFWDNRSYERVYNAFVDIWGTEKLWATIDRCNINFPNVPGYEFESFVHWDTDTSLDPIPPTVQGILYLNDTGNDQGGLHVLPDLFRDLPEWIKTQPADRNPFKPDYTGYEIIQPTYEAGDLIIFNGKQPHGLCANISDKPSVSQYISMFPAQEDAEDLREWRVKSWSERIAPQGAAFPGDPRNWEQEKYEKAELTELGEKLVGLKKW